MNDKQEHVERFHEWMKVAESPDAKVAAYKRAAGELRTLHSLGMTWERVGAEVGRSRQWVATLVKWSTTGSVTNETPFGGPEENQARYERADRRKVADIAAERPEVVAEAIAKADPETQRKIADVIVESETADPSLKRVAEGPKRQPRPEKPTEQILSGAVFALWNAYQRLLDETPDEQTKYMMGQSAGRAERLAVAIGQLLAEGSFDQELADLMASVEAEGQAI